MRVVPMAALMVASLEFQLAEKKVVQTVAQTAALSGFRLAVNLAGVTVDQSAHYSAETTVA
jgi:hypothetical protein